jgi:nucleoid-associated protein YgaU
MLNKDEYNQDEYNNYYAQEVRGAEISNIESENSGKKIVIILLLLLIIAVVGYFGFKSMNFSTQDTTTTDNSKGISKVEEESKEIKNIIDTPIKVSKEPTQTDKITKQLEKSIASLDSSSEEMNSEDIANLIKIVMIKMNKNKKKESIDNSSTPTNKEERIEETQLMKSLSNADVDSLSSISKDDDEKKSTLDEDIDIYNKVVLKENTSKNNDALSQLSDELSSVIDTESSAPTANNSYTESITQEVEIRKQEMRYYIVKDGDTLTKIAKRFYGKGMEYNKIYQANPDILRRPDKISIGQRLRIP